MSMQPGNRLAFGDDFLRRYLEVAPAALAIERSLECEILSKRPFNRPILDVGCGDGVFATILCADKIDTGIDYDAAEIERARRLNCYRELIVRPGASIPKPDGSYCTIFSNSALEHIPSLLPVLRELRRLLADGGHLYVTIPTDRWEKSALPARMCRALGLYGAAERYARFYNAFWNHYHALPEPHWIALFTDAGFVVTEHLIYAPPNVMTLLDVLTPLAAPAMISKRLFGRWIALPALRKLLVRLIYPFIAGVTAICNRKKCGTLLFLDLSIPPIIADVTTSPKSNRDDA